MAIIISLAFLGVGFLAGFLGQNSRMCFVGGFRDFLLVKDTGLLEGLMAFFVTTWLAVLLLRSTGVLVTQYPALKEAVFSTYGVVSVVGGVLFGFISTLSGGCPLRHHVLLGQGRLDSGVYFLGFYAGIFIYFQVVVFLLKGLF
jgi:uncharacterized membrane protein YedE/YeeE